MVNISFEKKVIMKLLGCSEIDLKLYENFINKFEEIYGSNLFNSFINYLKERVFKVRKEIIPEKGINKVIRYFLICNVIYEFEKQNNFEFKSFFTDIYEADYTNPNFRFDFDFFKELESELTENKIQKLVKELKCFLEM